MPGEALLLGGLRGEGPQLVDGVLEPFALASGFIELGPGMCERALGFAPCGMGGGERGGVVLAVDLDEQSADLAKQRDRRGLIVDARAAAAVGPNDAAQDQRLAGLGVETSVGEQRGDGMTRWDVESRRDHRALRASADQARIGAEP